MDPAAIAALAEEMLRLADAAALAEPPSACLESFSTGDAYAIALEAMRRRERSGWRRVGRKIGFTNRTIYEQYGVYAPIFGYMYDRTVSQAGGDGDSPSATMSLAGLVQPLIEPEIAFKLRRAPSPADSDQALLDCIEWLAHGFEVVQCHFPDWRFGAADTIADGGLHGRYVVGPPLAVTPDVADGLAERLAGFHIASYRDGELAAEGGGVLVLDSPLNALRHLVEVIEALPDHPRLEAGELVTTGTLTAALPVAAGQTWRTRIEGLELPGLELRFA